MLLVATYISMVLAAAAGNDGSRNFSYPREGAEGARGS